MAKKQTAGENLLNGKGTPKTEQTTATEPNLLKLVEKNPQEPTKEDLEKENAELKRKLSAMPKNLDEKISFYQVKQDLIKKFNQMETNESALMEHREKLAELSEEDEFSNTEYFLQVNCKAYNRDKDVFKISNPILIGELIDEVLRRMREKKDKLKAEIEA